jgi:hypothetical protein
MHNPPTLSFQDIVVQMDALAEQLKTATTTDERSTLLRQYRSLLEQADKAAQHD